MSPLNEHIFAIPITSFDTTAAVERLKYIRRKEKGKKYNSCFTAAFLFFNHFFLPPRIFSSRPVIIIILVVHRRSGRKRPADALATCCPNVDELEDA